MNIESPVSLYPAERQQQILTLLNHNGRVSVTELSDLFSVSEVTIRTDLQALASQGLIVRTHGGAVLASHSSELSLIIRKQQQVVKKNRIGSAAANFISNGDAVFLDASSTALALAHNLRQHRDLTILTHSLAIAQVMITVPGVTVVMTGGVLHRDTVSLMGLEGLGILSKYNIKSGFFGAHGLSFPEGLTDVSAGEAEVKREVVAMCHQTIAVIDATKWGRIGPASFANPQDLDIIITDENAPTELVDRARFLGARIVQV